MAEEWIKDLVETEVRRNGPISVPHLLASISEDADLLNEAVHELRAEQVVVLDSAGRLELADREDGSRPSVLRAVPEGDGGTPSGDDELQSELTDGAQEDGEQGDEGPDFGPEEGFARYRASYRVTLEWDAQVSDDRARKESLRLLSQMMQAADDHAADVVTARVSELSESRPRIIWNGGPA